MRQGLMVKVFFEAKNYVIVNKPAGIFCQPPDLNKSKLCEGTAPILMDMLRHQFPDVASNWRTVHRLDTNVTGGLVIAKDKNSAAMFSRNLKKGGNHGFKLTRKYVAIVGNKAKDLPEEGVLGGPGMLSWYKKGDPGLLVMQLGTGKKHQLRWQLSSLCGLPILNDVKYGGTPVLGAGRQIALHSAFIQTQVGLLQKQHLVPVESKFRGLWSKYVDQDGHFSPSMQSLLTKEWLLD